MDLRAKLPVFVKKLVWNFKYGVKKYSLGHAPKDAVTHLAKLPQEAHLLELGCGQGLLIRALRAADWRGTYCGVDISGSAIRRARENEGSASSAWMISDIESFKSDESWDAIAMIESIYYVDIAKVPEILLALNRMLKPNGYLLMRIYDFSKHREHVDAILSVFPHTERSGPLLVIHSRRELPRAGGYVATGTDLDLVPNRAPNLTASA